MKYKLRYVVWISSIILFLGCLLGCSKDIAYVVIDDLPIHNAYDSCCSESIYTLESFSCSIIDYQHYSSTGGYNDT